jgi:4-diphosphocytidyl-2-C-methyl-D-erythritol kinase
MILFPNAKINIGLDVISKKKDRYHKISSVFYPVLTCSDILEITKQQYFSFKSTGIEIPKGENLCEKAFHLLKQDFSIPNVGIHLHKQIPIGAGLGGGSADAAFTLKGLNDLFSLSISSKRLEEYALQLGADCPFFIENTSKYVEGIGERMTNIDLDLSAFEIRFVHSQIHISTVDAYFRVTPHFPETPLKELIKLPIDDWKEKIENDFEKNIFEEYPKLQSIKKQLYIDGAIYASMSGSGSTIYGIFANN